MKSDLSREDWLAIFEKTSSLEVEACKEACWLLVQTLGLEAAHYPGIQIALKEGRWRKAENPRRYVKTVARREVDRRRPPNLLEVPLDVIGGDNISHDEVMDRLTFANGCSTAVRSGDGVWRPGVHHEDYGGDDEYESPRDRLWNHLPPDLKVPIPLPPAMKRELEDSTQASTTATCTKSQFRSEFRGMGPGCRFRRRRNACFRVSKLWHQPR